MPANDNQADTVGDRRAWLVTGGCMAAGLAAGYGTLAAMAARFLYAEGEQSIGWQFVAPVSEFAVESSLEYVSPAGVKIVIARQAAEDTAAAFVALSSVCPHLGCAVHWEPHNNRFFCPCHNGVFDPQGQPTAGPPAADQQPLARFPLKVEDGLLFIEVSLAGMQGDS